MHASVEDERGIGEGDLVSEFGQEHVAEEGVVGGPPRLVRRVRLYEEVAPLATLDNVLVELQRREREHMCGMYVEHVFVCLCVQPMR